jgi:hypothetical protein
MNGAGLTVIVSLPFDVAVGVRLRDSKDSVDAVGAGPLVRRVVRRQDMLLLLHGMLLLLLLLLVLVVASRGRRSVSDDRGRLRRDWANRPTIAASSAVAAVTPVTSVSVTVSTMSMVADRFGFLRRFIPHNPGRKKINKNKIKYFKIKAGTKNV